MMTLGAAVALLAIPLLIPSQPPEPTGLEIVEESKRRNEPSTEVADFQLDLLDKDGDHRERRLTIYFKRDAAREVTLLKFTYPANYEGVGLLVENDHNSQMDIWTYAPSTRRLRRISGQQKQNWFMGTELTYEDFEGYEIPSYEFTLRGTESCYHDEQCFVVEATAKTREEGESTGYSKRVYWIESEKYYLVKTELFDKKGELTKVISNDEIQLIGDYFRPGKQTIDNLSNGRTNHLTAVSRKLDEPLDDYYVSQRFLRAK